MTNKPSRVRILIMPYQDDDDKNPTGYAGSAIVLTGLRRTIRRHELRLIVPLADSMIYEMEKRGEFPRRFNLSPRCIVWDLEAHRQACFEGRAKIAPGPDSISARPGRQSLLTARRTETASLYVRKRYHIF